MTDPILELSSRLRAAIAAAFGPEHADTDPALRRSDRADLQANVAMSLAKKLGKKPRDVADAIVAALDAKGVCAAVEVAGPGFLNLTLAEAFLSRCANDAAADDRLGVARAARPERVVIDYSSPNVAKELHVGHLRSTILGDAIARVLEHLGHTVIRQNHLGDWGTPFGMLLEQLIDQGGDASAVTDWNAFYRAARARFDEDPAFAERARKRVVSLQAGDPATLALWRTFVAQSRAYLARMYERLGATLKDDDVCGESFYNPMLAGVVADLEKKGLATESDGALCVFLPGFVGKTGEPLPLIVRKQDGGYGYATTDLAAIRHRVGTLGGERLLYVVGAPQQLHLSMVFAAAERAGWLAPPVRATHVAFGAMLGSDKKMFKTRAGGSIALAELLDEAEARAAAVIAEKSPEQDEPTRKELARRIGTGAIKYADLANDRIKDYVFDWDRMLSFDGNTAPYLQYAHARIRSMLRKAAEAPGAIEVTAPAERALVLELLGFGAAVHAVGEHLEPHRLCQYLFKLATAFTSFYEQCPVLRADGEAQRRSRIALSELTARVLSRGLGLLGIEAPERM